MLVRNFVRFSQGFGLKAVGEAVEWEEGKISPLVLSPRFWAW